MPEDVLDWLDYKWSFDFPVGMFRAICERLRGTPARLGERLADVPAARLTAKTGGKWSVLEHAGHLLLLEQMWQARVEEFLRGAERLRPADIKNQATTNAGFDRQPPAKILGDFRNARAETMRTLDRLTLEDAARTSIHPRLNVPMRLVDHCFFAAEHDDHHLALIHSLLTSFGK
jgi:uncharacterized damage-inducible protein DinB